MSNTGWIRKCAEEAAAKMRGWGLLELEIFPQAEKASADFIEESILAHLPQSASIDYFPLIVEEIEECAKVIDSCNRQGPYQAIGAASEIRARKGLYSKVVYGTAQPGQSQERCSSTFMDARCVKPKGHLGSHHAGNGTWQSATRRPATLVFHGVSSNRERTMTTLQKGQRCIVGGIPAIVAEIYEESCTIVFHGVDESGGESPLNSWSLTYEEAARASSQQPAPAAIRSRKSGNALEKK